jgi:glycine cleavage system aminomethyltransferase T
VTVLRGKKAVKRYKARTVAAKRTHRLKLPARKLAKRGDYRVRIVVGRGAGRVTSTLVSRKL